MSLEDVILIFGLPRSICKDSQKKKTNRLSVPELDKSSMLYKFIHNVVLQTKVSMLCYPLTEYKQREIK